MTDVASPPPGRSGRRRRRRRPWRAGGASWGLDLLGWAVLSMGLGALSANAALAMLPAPAAGPVSQAVIWGAFATPVVIALVRSCPLGLLGLRAQDAMYGIVFGLALRVTQGWMAGAGGEPVRWPAVPTIDGALPDGFPAEAVLGSLVGPVLEELFFRGLVLVCIYTLLRGVAGAVASGAAAVLVSTALFVGAHALVAAAAASDAASPALLGIVAGALVLGTGRLWPAVATHVVFNASGFALLAVGTLLG